MQAPRSIQKQGNVSDSERAFVRTRIAAASLLSRIAQLDQRTALPVDPERHRHYPKNKAKNPNFEVSSPPGAE